MTHCLTVKCEYMFKNYHFLIVNVSETVEQLKKFIQSLIMSFDLVLSIVFYFSKALVRTTAMLCVGRLPAATIRT